MANWKTSITVSDVFNDESVPIETLTSTIVERIRENSVCAAILSNEYDDGLADILESLVEVSDEDEFNEVWADLYDWADAHRVWVETMA